MMMMMQYTNRVVKSHKMQLNLCYKSTTVDKM